MTKVKKKTLQKCKYLIHYLKFKYCNYFSRYLNRQLIFYNKISRYLFKINSNT